MNQNLPVIATDAVGAAAGGLVRHERNGLVVRAGDPDALAAALRRLHDDPALRGATRRQRGARRRRLHPRRMGRRLRRRPARRDRAGGPLLALGTQPGRGNATAPARCARAMRRLLTALTILCLAVPATAGADGGVTKLLRDACRDEHIDGTYTQAEYKKALDQLPTDSDEYTGCREVLQRGRLAALGAGKHKSCGRRRVHRHGRRNRGRLGLLGLLGRRVLGHVGLLARAPAPTRWPPPRPQQKKALAQAAQSAKPVNVGGELVQPGALGLGELSGAGRGVPTPLIALICLLAATALGAGGWWLWSRVLTRRFG